MLKKNEEKKKKSPENYQLTGHFQSSFIYFFRPPALNLIKKFCKLTNKNILALCMAGVPVFVVPPEIMALQKRSYNFPTPKY